MKRGFISSSDSRPGFATCCAGIFSGCSRAPAWTAPPPCWDDDEPEDFDCFF